MVDVNYEKEVKINAQNITGQLTGPITLSKKKDETLSNNSNGKKDTSYETTTFISQRFLYWTGIAFLLVINFLITILLLPFILIMKGLSVYFIVASMGMLFGLIFNFLIKDLEHLERRHHLFAGLLIPLIAIMNLFVINFISRNMAVILNIRISHNPLVAGSIYLLAFMAPFAYSLLIKKEIS